MTPVEMPKIAPITNLSHDQKSNGPLGWVYFIGDGSAIKIGFAVDYQTRFHELQVGNPRELRLKSVVRAYRSAERAFHMGFEKFRIRGEWFNLRFDLDELWDDIVDYKLHCCDALICQGREPPEDPDDIVFDTEDIPVLLETIGKPWPKSFIVSFRNHARCASVLSGH